MSTSALLIALAVLALGLAATARLAFGAHKQASTLAGYFLGNRTLGPKLTNQNFWATSFALANGLAYFSTLGYKYGLKAALFQVPWFLSFALLAWQIPRILAITRNKTLHKFLGDQFGSRVRIISACITLVAVLSTILYEIHLSSQIVLQVLRRESVPIGPDFYVFIVVAALLAIWYVDAGGFLGTAKTDKIQNTSGFYATCVVIVGLVVAGARTPELNNYWSSLGAAVGGATSFGYEAIPLLVVSGILCYASVWNIVDPSNWQAWSANSDLTDSESVSRLRKETLKSAGKMMLLPCLGGVLLGVLAKSGRIGGNEYDHLPAAVIASIDQWSTLFGLFSSGWMGHELLVGLLTGLICFGLFSIALSTIDSYMISASQTYCWDLHSKHRQTVEAIIETDDASPTPESDAKGKAVVLSAKQFLYIATLISLFLFEAMVRLISKESDVFVVQFLMGSVLVAVAPPLAAAFIHDARASPAIRHPILSWGIALALTGGMLATIAIALRALKLGDEFNAYAWGPIASLLTSTTIVAATYIIWWIVRRGGRT